MSSEDFAKILEEVNEEDLAALIEQLLKEPENSEETMSELLVSVFGDFFTSSKE